jgi:hypothetical protein
MLGGEERSMSNYSDYVAADLQKTVDELRQERDTWRTLAKMMIAQIDPESPAWAEYWKVQRGEQ